MNPSHPKNLDAALYKFGFMTYSQIFSFFAGEIRGCTVDRCIARLSRDQLMIGNRLSSLKRTLYMHWSETYMGDGDYRIPKHYRQSPIELSHRIACNEVYLSLAKRGFVSNVISEHEIKRFKIDCKVIDRKPDGLFTLSREDRAPIDIAIEVETTLRNKSRINEVIESYVNTYDQNPEGLRGVLIIAPHSNIASAYRESISQIGKKYPNRFILSDRLYISDVKETILGTSILPLSKHPKNHVLNWISTCPRKSFKTEHALVRKNLVGMPMYTDTMLDTGEK